MASKKINLIPQELSVGGSINKLSKNIKTISTFGGVFALISAIAFLSIFLFFSFQIKNVEDDSVILKRQMSSLEGSEQKLVFVKDRLSKISDIQNGENATDEVLSFEKIYESISDNQDIGVTEVNIDSKGLEFSVLAKKLSTFKNFFESIYDEKENFSKVSLSSFIYSPDLGYIAGLNFETK